ncbi:TPA: hypothetical protein ACGIKW_001734 [Acinetobacter baumannii]|uniref:hypothetical protein n=1 Tax=Acinetobacter baumannii TaxID=470 RepID=UPI0033900C85
MIIDLSILRKELEAHKETLKKHNENDQLAFYRAMFGLDSYVQRVIDYKNGIDHLEIIFEFLDSNILNEAFEELNIAANADEIKRKNLSNPKLFKMITDISSRLKDHKIILDQINLTISH